MLKLAAAFIRKPSAALDYIDAQPREASLGGAGIFAAHLAAAVIFYTLKPDGFPPPPPGAESGPLEHGLLFWAGVQAWSPVLLAVWIAAAAWFGKLLGSGKLAVRLPAALAAGVIPLLLIAVYNNSGMSKPAFAACWTGLIAVMIPGFLRVKKGEWLRLAAALAGLHAAAIVLLLPFTLAVLARSAWAYHAVEFAMLLWILRLATLSLGRILDIRTARAFCAVFLSLIAQIMFVFAMHMLGVLPKEVLKALMAA